MEKLMGGHKDRMLASLLPPLPWQQHREKGNEGLQSVHNSFPFQLLPPFSVLLPFLGPLPMICTSSLVSPRAETSFRKYPPAQAQGPAATPLLSQPCQLNQPQVEIKTWVNTHSLNHIIFCAVLPNIYLETRQILGLTRAVEGIQVSWYIKILLVSSFRVSAVISYAFVLIFFGSQSIISSSQVCIFDIFADKRHILSSYSLN